ncbi:MAG: CE1 family esterase [Dehalococcoidia bacterium]
MFRWIVAPALIAAALAGCRGAAPKPANTPPGSPAMVATRIAAAGCTPARTRAAGDSNETIASGGLTRTYILHVPTGYQGTSPTPVVLLFHGFALSADFMRSYTKFSDVADAHQFILIIPNGSGSPQYWNSNGVPGGPNDVAFVRDLLAKVGSELCVDPARVYAAGYSNGGGMAQLLACELPRQIAAVGLVASEYGPCDARVPMIAFHGTADPVLPFEGAGGTGAGSASFPPIRMVVSAWAAGLGCDRLPTISRPAPDVELSTFHNCIAGDAQVLLYAVLGGGHTWPGAAFPVDAVGRTTQEINASATIWGFFAAHPRTP